jgi:preprotein translocase subunit SecG
MSLADVDKGAQESGMNWLHTTAIVFHVLFAAGIVGLVLLQRGKGADAGAGFGAGASGTVFGARGSASFLSRTTAVLAALFICTSLTLAYLGSRQTQGAPSSVIDRVKLPAAAPSVIDTLPEVPAATDGAVKEQPAPPPAAPEPAPK